MPAEFVKTEGGRFTLGGEPVPATGVNCYFLAYCSDESRRHVMRAARAIGANVIRAWAFFDVANRSAVPVAFQHAEGGGIVQDTGPDGLERLDALIAAAEEFNIRLVLPFVNYWDDFGGMRQYLRWLGLDTPLKERFYSDPAAIAAYENWVRAILTRRNTLTGRLYLEESAIMAWELANEPRCPIDGGRPLMEWIGQVSAFVKGIDANHLLAVGDEGFLYRAGANDHLYDGRYGVDCEAILNVAQIDFGTYHFYPEGYSKPPRFADHWIREHVMAGQRVNKPMLLAEYGLKSRKLRNNWYARWKQSVRSAGGAGDLLWMLGDKGSDVAGFRDEYTVYGA